MWVGIWLAIGLFATAWTFLWVLGRERIYIKAAVSLGSWALLALTGSDVYALTDTGETIALEVASLQVFAAGLAVLSFLVLVLYRFDEYPPRQAGGDA
jgi:hypothetical protein